MLLDSNIIIYAIEPRSADLREMIRSEFPHFSEVSYVEVLGFRDITADAMDAFAELFAQLRPLPVSRDVIDCAVELRQQRRMSLGDSIIAAKALVHDLTLVTRNVDDFRWIPLLKLLDPFEP